MILIRGTIIIKLTKKYELFKLAFVFITVFLSSSIIYGQGGGDDGRSIPMQMIIPVTNFNDLGKVGNDLYNKDRVSYDTTMVPYWIDNYRDSIISTNFFASLYPDYPIPVEDIEIIPPDFSSSEDAVVIMWYLQSESDDDLAIINIMILTLHHDSSIYYHVDYNNNRNFNDDRIPFKFPPKKRHETVTIIENNHVYNFRVNNLNYIEPESFTISPRERDMLWKSADKKPAFITSFSISTGTGDPEMSYVPVQPSDTQLIEYTANVDCSFEFKLKAGISFYRINLCLLGAYEKEETSLTNQYVYIRTYDGQIEKRIRNNTGGWPEYKFTYGLHISYDIPVFRPFRLSPYFGIGSWVYAKDQLFLKTSDYEDRYITDYIKDKMYISYGLELKFIISKSSSFFIHSGFKQMSYDASEFFIDADPKTFNQKYNLFYFGAGALFRL